MLFSNGAINVLLHLRCKEERETVRQILSTLQAAACVVLRHHSIGVLQTNNKFVDTTLLLIPSIPRWGSRCKVAYPRSPLKYMALRGKELMFIDSQYFPMQLASFGKVLLIERSVLRIKLELPATSSCQPFF